MAILRVTARLGAPVALREALHLDGILAAAHPDTVGGHLHRASDAVEVRRPRLPVLSKRIRGEECHLASAEEWPEGASRRSGHLTSRRDGEDLDHLTRPIQTASGPERDVMLRFPVVEAPTVSWWCVGDRQGVGKLLRRVEAVGALRRHGYGTVLSWDVERVNGTMEPVEVVLHGGVARRHLPASWCDGAESIDVGATRVPYWHSSSVGPRVRRGTPTGLAPDVLEALVGVT